MKAIAAGLVGALRALNVQPQYVHVADALYRDRHGQALSSVAPDTITADQRAARAEYQGGLAPDFGRLTRALIAQIGARRNATAIRNGVRRFATGLFQGDPVPLRDLTDHAPINYVSLFTGR